MSDDLSYWVEGLTERVDDLADRVKDLEQEIRNLKAKKLDYSESVAAGSGASKP